VTASRACTCRRGRRFRRVRAFARGRGLRVFWGARIPHAGARAAHRRGLVDRDCTARDRQVIARIAAGGGSAGKRGRRPRRGRPRAVVTRTSPDVLVASASPRPTEPRESPLERGPASVSALRRSSRDLRTRSSLARRQGETGAGGSRGPAAARQPRATRTSARARRERGHIDGVVGGRAGGREAEQQPGRRPLGAATRRRHRGRSFRVEPDHHRGRARRPEARGRRPRRSCISTPARRAVVERGVEGLGVSSVAVQVAVRPSSSTRQGIPPRGTGVGVAPPPFQVRVTIRRAPSRLQRCGADLPSQLISLRQGG